MTPTTSQKIDTLATKAQTPPNWVWALLGTVIVGLTIWYLRYELSKKSQELADANTKLETAKIQAQQDILKSKVAVDEDKRKAAEAVAAASLAKVLEDQKALDTAKAAHETNVAKLNAVAAGDWDALNKIAGTK